MTIPDATQQPDALVDDGVRAIFQAAIGGIRTMSDSSTEPENTYEIEICDRQILWKPDLEVLRDVVAETLRVEGVATAQLSLVLVDDAEIHRVNREYLGHDYPTDVISFSLDEQSQGAFAADDRAAPRGQGRQIDGELIVSTQTALRSSSDYGWSPESEVILYVVHGLLHLCGYDDMTDAERSIMRLREREILALRHLRPRYDEDAG